uniref:Uncharacterized protein n=1 Tax=Trypanosoma vivax (strain Y486) TaxID=1055687 RepID=G0U197_TRYVY|nr:hypothetical protein, unlikely [Trypanosoma vivax Y486]
MKKKNTQKPYDTRGGRCALGKRHGEVCCTAWWWWWGRGKGRRNGKKNKRSRSHTCRNASKGELLFLLGCYATVTPRALPFFFLSFHLLFFPLTVEECAGGGATVT